MENVQRRAEQAEAEVARLKAELELLRGTWEGFRRTSSAGAVPKC